MYHLEWYSASPGAKLTALDEAGARAIAGVIAVVRDGSFAGVVAETEGAAQRRESIAMSAARSQAC